MPEVRVRVRSVPRRGGFDPALLRRLHAFANRLLAEDVDHFSVHAGTNEVVHIFERADTGDVVGFQFWRTGPFDLPRSRAIMGGKLRVDPAFRNRALHLVSGLRFYAECQLRAPATRFYRLSLASLFGFVSITSALAEYRLLDPRATDRESRAILAAFERLAGASDYRLDPATGLIFVDIRPTPETLAQFSPAYFARPEARAYIAANPDWRDNGKNVGFWFRFSPKNLAKIAHTIWRKRQGGGGARRSAEAA
jgi:hypothetical protein